MVFVLQRQIVFIISLCMGLDCVCIDMNKTQKEYLTKKRIYVSSTPTFSHPLYVVPLAVLYLQLRFSLCRSMLAALNLFVLQTSEMTFIALRMCTTACKCFHWFLNPITQTQRAWIHINQPGFERNSTQFIRHNPTIIERISCHFSFFPGVCSNTFATMVKIEKKQFLGEF